MTKNGMQGIKTDTFKQETLNQSAKFGTPPKGVGFSTGETPDKAMPCPTRDFVMSQGTTKKGKK